MLLRVAAMGALGISSDVKVQSFYAASLKIPRANLEQTLQTRHTFSNGNFATELMTSP
jgi:hypothetical protein